MELERVDELRCVSSWWFGLNTDIIRKTQWVVLDRTYFSGRVLSENLSEIYYLPRFGLILVASTV